MQKLIIVIIGMLLYSCQQFKKEGKSKTEIVRKYDYQIDIAVWNGFAGYKVKYQHRYMEWKLQYLA